MTAENLHNWDLIVISLRTLESPRDSTCIRVRPTALLLPQLAIHCSVEWSKTFVGEMFENLGLAVERRAEEFVCLGLGSRSKNYENFGAEMFHKLSSLQPVGLCCCWLVFKTLQSGCFHSVLRYRICSVTRQAVKQMFPFNWREWWNLVAHLRVFCCWVKLQCLTAAKANTLYHTENSSEFMLLHFLLIPVLLFFFFMFYCTHKMPSFHCCLHPRKYTQPPTTTLSRL